MEFRAILMAILIACGMAGALLLLATVLEVSTLDAPQVLTVFALWIVPGYYAANRVAHAGTLHGMLTGLFGMLVVFFSIELAASLHMAPFELFEQKSPFIFIILAGFWASVGGMIADIVRLIKAKRALSRGKERLPDPD